MPDRQMTDIQGYLKHSRCANIWSWHKRQSWMWPVIIDNVGLVIINILTVYNYVVLINHKLVK